VSATRKAPFWVTPDESIEVPMMSQTSFFNYMENDTLQMLELPYKGDELARTARRFTETKDRGAFAEI